MSKNIENRATTYGSFTEIPGNMGRVNIDSEWVMENVARYKELGHTLENCDKELTSVVSNEQFIWASAEMEAQFHKDIATFFEQ